MNNYALITGASTGIGYELSRIAAENKYNLILIARNKTKLEEIKKDFEEKYKIQVEVIALDLSDINSPKQIWDTVSKNNWPVQILINNAGFANNGEFEKLEWENERQQLQVNVGSLMELCHRFIPNLIATRQGRIMNVSSVASFIPGPYMATYYASKAFVKSFSIALSAELEDKGITVSTLCPGATDTGFFERAKFAAEATKKHSNLMMTAAEVAQTGWNQMFKGKRVIVTGIPNKIAVVFSKFIPDYLLTKGTKFFNKTK